MTKPATAPWDRLSTVWQRGKALLVVLAGICVVTIAFLVFETFQQLGALGYARSDNVQWVLSRAEVEYLEFRTALAQADGPDARPADLDALIVEFDVFYSRMTTLGTGSLYADLRKQDGFGPPVQQIRAALDAMLPLIDGPRDPLKAELGTLAESADQIRPNLRIMATAGLQYFAERSDQSRESLATTLLRLAVMLFVLFLALVVVLNHSQVVGRQTRAKGEELADAYARLNTILETSLDAVIVSDLDGRILNFNAAAERIFQHQAEEVVGRNLADVIVPDHLRDAHSAGMARMKHSGEQRVVGKGRVRLEAKRANDEVFPVELALENARAGDQEIVVAFLRDISHRVSAEAELVAARDKALAGEQAKAEFLAMMTHEIRTPLNGLLGNLTLLEQTALAPAQDRYVRNMTFSGEVLMHHVDAVLDVARFEAGGSDARAQSIHLGRLLQNVVESQAIAAQANGNHIQWGWIGAPVDWARLDATRLQQVLLNLVGNAIKFTRDGRILIEAEAVVKPDGAMLDLRVIDTGTGIPEADQQRVFQDFQTAHGAEQSGTGLGLSIAQRFVAAMGGEIGVESTEGEGSVFWLRLPFETAAGPDRIADPGPAPLDLPGLAVLLVEDNQINLDLAHEMLAGLGHHVTLARDGIEAVAAAERQRFDLILMDIRMPRLDGLGATQQIRSGQGASADVPIVALSANVLPEARERFTAAGMSGFLPKPLKLAELQQGIALLCAGSDSGPAPATQSPSAAREVRLARLQKRHMAEATAFLEWLSKGATNGPEIAERAHQLAGGAAAFGQAELSAALVQLEVAAEAADAGALTEAVAKVQSAWSRAPNPSLS